MAGDFLARQIQMDVEGGDVNLNRVCIVSVVKKGCGFIASRLMKGRRTVSERQEKCKVCRSSEFKTPSHVHDNLK